MQARKVGAKAVTAAGDPIPATTLAATVTQMSRRKPSPRRRYRFLDITSSPLRRLRRTVALTATNSCTNSSSFQGTPRRERRRSHRAQSDASNGLIRARRAPRPGRAQPTRGSGPVRQPSRSPPGLPPAGLLQPDVPAHARTRGSECPPRPPYSRVSAIRSRNGSPASSWASCSSATCQLIGPPPSIVVTACPSLRELARKRRKEPSSSSSSGCLRGSR